MIRRAKIIAVLGLLALCSSTLALGDTGLISHWKFDEGEGGIAYDSVGGNHGTLVNGPAWTTGQIDGALNFDGVDDYVEIPDDDSLTPNTEITISFWIYNMSGRSGGVYKIATCPNERYSPGNSRAYWLQVCGSPAKLELRIHSAVRDVGFISSNNSIPLYEWHHVAGTFNLGSAAVFIDGQLDNSGILPVTSIMNDVQPLMIGSFWNYCGADNLRTALNGIIDEVAIWDRALSAEEIEELYQEGLGDLVELEVVGPNEVAEDFGAQYKAIAHYDNNSTKDVTDSADWQVEPNVHASIENGLLTTESINQPEEDITIYAQYTEGEVTVEAEKEVSVLAVCPTGTALSFDGVDDYVDVDDDNIANFNNKQSVTYSAWIKPSAIIGRHAIVMSSYNGNIDLDINPTNFRFFIQTINGWDQALSSITPSADTWYHVVGTYNGSEARIYVNGNLEGSDSTNSGNIQIDARNWDNTRIGKLRDSGSTWEFNGIIDDVRIYDRALSAEEIRANMHTRLTGDEPGLVGYWDFDEGEGQVAYDLSPYGNHGRLGSTPNADASDPDWIESDAPIGICTLEGLVERNLSDVLDIKLDILEQLGIALAREEAVVDILNTSFENRDFGSAKKGDVVTAKQKIHSAMQHEEQAEAAVDKSIEKLEDASAALGLEP